MQIKWQWKTEKVDIQGFRYLWLKTVESFNPQYHCAKCLVGKYSKAFSPRMPRNQPISEDYNIDTILYFCGVSTPYKWDNNFHFVGKVSDTNTKITIPLYSGDAITIEGIKQINIDPTIALLDYPDLSEKYLTCRNFQLGAQLFQ